MKVIGLASAGLAAFLVLIPGAQARKADATVSYTPEIRPLTFTFGGQGASADILGIKPGMAASQADAIAAKFYGGPAGQVENVPDTFFYKGVLVQSHAFAHWDLYSKDLDHGGTDSLHMSFGGPAAGNGAFYLNRTVYFVLPPSAKSARVEPRAADIRTALLKKYGPTSIAPDQPQVGGTQFFKWIYTKKGLKTCASRNDCSKIPDPTTTNYGIPENLTGFDSRPLDIPAQCGVGGGAASDILIVTAAIGINGTDATRADSLMVGMLSPQHCLHDITESVKQMKAAAVKTYAAANKSAGAAPKL